MIRTSRAISGRWMPTTDSKIITSSAGKERRMKYADSNKDVCLTCHKEKCAGTISCMKKRREQLEKEQNNG